MSLKNKHRGEKGEASRLAEGIILFFLVSSVFVSFVSFSHLFPSDNLLTGLTVYSGQLGSAGVIVEPETIDAGGVVTAVVGANPGNQPVSAFRLNLQYDVNLEIVDLNENGEIDAGDFTIPEDSLINGWEISRVQSTPEGNIVIEANSPDLLTVLTRGDVDLLELRFAANGEGEISINELVMDDLNNPVDPDLFSSGRVSLLGGPIYIWVVGGHGEINRSNDGGQTWTGVDIGPMNLIDVYFADQNTGWALAEERNSPGKVFATTDGGRTWVEQLNLISEAKKIHFIDRNNGWALGYYNIFKTNDGGENWQEMTKAGGEGTLYTHIFFIDEDVGWVTSRNKVFKTINGGADWEEPFDTLENEDSIKFMSFIDVNTGWLVTNPVNGQVGVFKTNNGGENWLEMFRWIVYRPSKKEFMSAYFKDENFGIVVGNDGNVGGSHFKTNDGGGSWEDVRVADEDLMFDNMYFLNENLGWGIGGRISKKLLRTANGGDTWELLGGVSLPGNSRDVFALVGTPPSECTDIDNDLYCEESGGVLPLEKMGWSDCNDQSANVNPRLSEVCDDGLDNDCNGLADDEELVCGAVICGSGTKEEEEECDDGNQDESDGCSADCFIEAGWLCSGEPSVCRLIGCGDTIEGEVILIENITGCEGRGITISSDDTKLDCQGHSITGMRISQGIRAELPRDINFASAWKNVTIKNCVVSNFSSGFFIDYGGNVLPLLGLSFVNNTAYNNSEDGFRLRVSNSEIVNNTAFGNTGWGMHFNVEDGGLLGTEDSNVSGNVIRNNGAGGIDLPDYTNQHGNRYSGSYVISDNIVCNNNIVDLNCRGGSGPTGGGNLFGEVNPCFESNWPSRYNGDYSLCSQELAEIDGSVLNCGDIIQGNFVFMNNDLVCEGDALNIVSHGTTLDCQGHSITGDGTGTGISLDGGVDKREFMEVRNCIISNFSEGVEINNIWYGNVTNNSILNCSGRGVSVEGARRFHDGGAQNNTIEGNIISGGRIGIYNSVSEGTRIVGNEVSNSSYGVWSNWGVEVLENQFFNNTKGIYFRDGGGQARGNFIYNNSQGIVLSGVSDVLVEGNEISENDIAGISTYSWSSHYGFVGNEVHDNKGSGISASGNGFARDNLVYDNLGEGISFSEGSGIEITGNTVYGNSRSGIRMGTMDVGIAASNSRIADNTVYDNGEEGIFSTYSKEITIEGNNVYNNAKAGIALGRQTHYFQVTANVVYDNFGSGFFVGRNSHSHDFIRNEANDNREAGFDLLNTTGGNRLISNVMEGNGEYGIAANSSNLYKRNRACGNGETDFFCDWFDGMGSANQFDSVVACNGQWPKRELGQFVGCDEQVPDFMAGDTNGDDCVDLTDIFEIYRTRQNYAGQFEEIAANVDLWCR